jgi:hypothetical protein
LLEARYETFEKLSRHGARETDAVPPEPLRYTGIALTRWSLRRADRNRGAIPGCARWMPLDSVSLVKPQAKRK